MWPAAIVVTHPLGQDLAEMSVIEGEHPVQAFATYGADQSLAECVGVSRALHLVMRMSHLWVANC